MKYHYNALSGRFDMSGGSSSAVPPGGVGFLWNFDDVTTESEDPGSGNVRLNDTSFGVADVIIFSTTDADSNDLSSFLPQSLTGIGIMKMYKQSDPDNYLLMQIDSTPTEGSGYIQVHFVTLDSAGSFFADGDDLVVSFTPFREGLLWKGLWSEDFSYFTNDLISNDGAIYYCTDSHTSTTDDEPGVGVNESDYWEVFHAAGLGGSDTQIQFNDGGSLNGDAGLTYAKTTDTLSVLSVNATAIIRPGDNKVDIGASTDDPVNIVANNEIISTFSGWEFGAQVLEQWWGDKTILLVNAPAASPEEATVTTMLDLGSGNKEWVDWTIEDYAGVDHKASINIAKAGSGTIVPFVIRTWDQDAGTVADVGKEYFTITPGSEVVINESSQDVNFRVEGDSDTHLLFADAGAGFVGINQSSHDGWAKFHVNGGTRFDDDFRFQKGSGTQYVARMGGSGYDLVFATNNGGTDLLTLTGDGAISLGNDSAFTGLVINETGANADFRIEGDTDTENFFSDASTDRIGIGTTSPAYKLDVDGTSNATLVLENTNPVQSSRRARRMFHFVEDFVNQVNNPYLLYTGNGSNSNNSTLGDTSAGEVFFNTGTGTTGRYGVWSNNVSVLYFNVNAVWHYEQRVKFSALSDGTNTFKVFAGFLDSATTDATDGCYFSYTHSLSSGNWECVSRSNSTETGTRTDSGVAAAADTWFTLRVDVRDVGGTLTARFYINDTLVGTHTANIPSSSARATGYGTHIVKSAGNTNRFTTTDYIEVSGYFSGNR